MIRSPCESLVHNRRVVTTFSLFDCHSQLSLEIEEYRRIPSLSLEARTGLPSPIYSYELLPINLFSSPKDPE